MCRAQFHDTRPCLPELPVADPPVGEDQVLHRPRAPHHRSDRHHRHAFDERAARQLAAQASMVNAMMAGMEARARARRMVRAKQAFHVFRAGADAGPLPAQSINTLRDLSGGALIMLPSSIHDFEDPQLEKIIGLTQRAAKMSRRKRSNSSRPRGTPSAPNSARGTRNMRCSTPAPASSPPATASAPSTGPAPPAWWRT